MLRIVSTLLIALSLSTPLLASEAPDWLLTAIKTENPESLGYFTTVGKDCPFTEEEFQDITDGIFIRSRIKPHRQGVQGLYIDITINCMKLKNNNPVFNADITFARYNPKPAIKFDYSFGTIGIGNKNFIINSVKTKVEDALTTYIKSNFNL